MLEPFLVFLHIFPLGEHYILVVIGSILESLSEARGGGHEDQVFKSRQVADFDR